MIVTFYSYKGGVGRSMALANIADLFCQSGLHVLMVDWDLEAPGLERFFVDNQTDFLKHPGLIDLLLEYKRRMALPSAEAADPDDQVPLQSLNDYLVTLVTDGASGGRVQLLPAGRRDGTNFSEYARLVRTFDWQDFYERWEGEAFFEWLRTTLLTQADVVLIDSRTGVSEMGGVCVYQMADAVLLFCAPNQQNLDGTQQMVQDFTRKEVREFRRNRDLSILVIPARVEDRAESSLLSRFRTEFTLLFDKYIPDTLSHDLNSLWSLKIPYVPYYAFNEMIAVKSLKQANSEDLIKPFIRISNAISTISPQKSVLKNYTSPRYTNHFTNSGFEGIESNVNIGAQGGVYGNVNIFNHIPLHLGKGTAPGLPSLFIGRNKDIDFLRNHFRLQKQTQRHSLLVIRGWTGIGKTTFAAAMAHDPESFQLFPDGVLWVALGKNPDIFAQLNSWYQALGLSQHQCRDTEEFSALLRAILREQRVLLIIDDVWDTRDVEPFRVGGRECATLVTTHLTEVAYQIAPNDESVYVLDALPVVDGIELMRQIAPKVVAEHPEECNELVRDLEGLPLAIQVASRLLSAEQRTGFNVVALIKHIRNGSKLIEAQVPADRLITSRSTWPTVGALLDQSVEMLDPALRASFAALAVVAPKPASFDTDALKYLWDVDDPRPTIRALVDRGLLEPTGSGRFWMHSLLVAHARTLLTD